MSKVKEHMTLGPYLLRPNHSLRVAQNIMRDKKIRHLPVFEASRAVGVLSDADLAQAALSRADFDQTTVETVMNREPYVVAPDTPLDQVVAAMAQRKLEVALVIEAGRMRGIFTTVDALKLLAQLLQDDRAVRLKAGASGPAAAPG